MVDKIKKVSNPLTIIAIFAGLAEVAATVALGLIDSSIQIIFIWFVMLFPVLLVVSFFLVLWFKPKNLYAPSDYIDENNFMRNMDIIIQAESSVDEAIVKLTDAPIEHEVKQKVLVNLNDVKEAFSNMEENIDYKGGSFDYIKNNKRSYLILEVLGDGTPRRATDLATTTKTTQSMIRIHLNILKDMGLVKAVYINNVLHYSLTEKGSKFFSSLAG